jgi:hypothetical protein
VFMTIMESSRLPLTVPQVLHDRGGWWLGQFLKRLLSEVFDWRRG